MANSNVSSASIITRPPVSVAEAPTHSLISVTQVRNTSTSPNCFNSVAYPVATGTGCGAIGIAAGFFLAPHGTIAQILLPILGSLSCFATGAYATKILMDGSCDYSRRPTSQENSCELQPLPASSQRLLIFEIETSFAGEAVANESNHPSFSHFPPSYDEVMANEERFPSYNSENYEEVSPPSYTELSFSDDENSLDGLPRVPSEISFLDALGLNALDGTEE